MEFTNKLEAYNIEKLLNDYINKLLLFFIKKNFKLIIKII